MMKELVKLIIASHKRPDRCLTYKKIANCAICVPKSQAKDYEKHNKGAEIIAHPDNVIGLSAKFRWVHERYPDVVLLDDDCWMKNNG